MKQALIAILRGSLIIISISLVTLLLVSAASLFIIYVFDPYFNIVLTVLALCLFLLFAWIIGEDWK